MPPLSSQATGMLIGGFLAAVLFGIGNLFSKASAEAGIGLGIFIIIVGLAVTIVGCIIYLLIPDPLVSMRSALSASGLGFMWGLGTACVVIALQKYNVPLGSLVPLYNMNTLIAVTLALWIFSEWRQVHVFQLVIGSLFIVLGGVLVARA